MNLILLGMPGAGKGTQAEFIQKDYGLANISTGAMMREVSRSESKLASKVQTYLSSGALVPNEIIIEMLVERIQKEDKMSIEMNLAEMFKGMGIPFEDGFSSSENFITNVSSYSMCKEIK